MAGAWEIASNRKVLAYTIHTDSTSMAWAAAFRRLIIPGDFTFLTGMPFDHCRNAAVQQFLASPFQWLFSLDSDVICPPDTILRLLSKNLPVVSALYCRRSPPHAVPVMIKNGSWVTNYRSGSLVEVDWVGAGALLVHRNVFERMPAQRPGKPWFDWRVDLRGTGLYPDDMCLSEDFTWCQAVKRTLGISTYVDTSTIVDHTGLFRVQHNKVEPLAA